MKTLFKMLSKNISKEVHIKKAVLKDLNQVYNLGSKFEDSLKASKIKSVNFHEKAEFKEFIKHPKENIFLVAVLNKEIIGFLYARIISSDWCMLDDLAVDKIYQNHGVGSLLLNNFYTLLKKKKITYVQILEEIHHKKTRHFWRSKGFKEEKVFVWADKLIK